jgi:hypothetical protein
VIKLRERCVIVYRDPSKGDYRLEQKLYSGTIAPLAFPDVVIYISQLLD